MEKVRLHKVVLPKDKILAIPDCQRLFLVYAGHISNEVNWFNKVMLLLQQTGNEVAEKLPGEISVGDRAHMDANAAQVLIVLRLFAGKLVEAIKFIRRWAFDMPWFEELSRDFPEDGRTAFDKLKLYIEEAEKNRSKHLLLLVRDKFAFHYDDKAVKQSMSVVDLVDNFPWYLATNNGNALYLGSEFAVTSTLLDMIDASPPETAIEMLMDECLMVAPLIQDVLGQSLACLALKYFGSTFSDLGLTEIIDIDAPELGAMRLPFFTAPVRRKV